MFLLGIINAMMNLKQFGPLVLIYVLTAQVIDSQWLYLVVGHLCNNNNNNIILINDLCITKLPNYMKSTGLVILVNLYMLSVQVIMKWMIKLLPLLE